MIVFVYFHLKSILFHIKGLCIQMIVCICVWFLQVAATKQQNEHKQNITKFHRFTCDSDCNSSERRKCFA